MQVTYVGRSHAGIELVLPNGGAVHVDHGASVDVPDDVAADLLTQEGQWKATPAPKTQKAAPADVPEED